MSTQNLISLWGAGGAIVVSFLAFGFSIYTYSQVRRSKRRKLINTIYHHADRTIQLAKAYKKAYRNARESLEKNPTYTPFALMTSSTDDLTYDQVIDALEWLSEEKEENAVLSYFHGQAVLLALGQSFNSEFVRSWDKDRKLNLLGILDKHTNETIRCAHEAKEFLDTKRSYRK